MSKKNSLLIWITFGAYLFMLISPVRSDASIIESWTDQADVVCVASFVSSTQTSEKLPFTSNYPYFTVSAHFRIRKVLKGDALGQDLLLRTYRVDMHNIATGSGYPEFIADFGHTQNYLIFGKWETGHQFLSLVAPYQGGASIVPVGTKLPADSNAPIIRNILKTLVSTLDDPDEQMAVRCLIYVGDYWKAHAGEIANSSHEGKDSSAVSLTTLLQTHIAPAVRHLIKSTDEGVRLEALYRAAQLQMDEVVPALLAIAQSQSQDSPLATGALGQFSAKVAIPPLASLLKSSNPDVRKTSVTCLGNEQDRRALPFLLDALADPDAGVRYQATYSLWQIVGQMPPAAQFGFASVEPQYQTFWKDWAAIRQDELGKLRQQVENLRLENSLPEKNPPSL